MLILANKGDERKVIEEEKEEWVLNVLSSLGVSNEIFNLEKGKLLEHLFSHHIEVWKNGEGVDILKNDKIVAQWKKPEIIIRKNKNEFYCEIHLNEWTQLGGK
jgi:hypothetical protein